MKGKINEVHEKAPKYGQDLNGYGDFFKVWLDTVKEFYK